MAESRGFTDFIAKPIHPPSNQGEYTMSATQARELQVQERDLRITLQGTTIKIELPLSPTGRPNEMPFAAVDTQKREDYLTSAQNTLTRYLVNQAGITGFNVDKITGGGEAGGDVRAINIKLNGSAEANRVFNNQALLDTLQTNFDAERRQNYMQAAVAWTRGIGTEDRGGGATVPYNGKEVKVTDNVAYDYYQRNFDNTPGYTESRQKYEELNQLGKLVEHRDRFEARNNIRSSADDTDRTGASLATNSLSPGNDRINRQFEQALKGTNGNPDAAAVAVDTISRAPGYKPDQDIAVVQGRNGQLIATQGQGDTALNVPVPPAKAGDFERVSQQMMQAPQPSEIAQSTDQPQRARSV
jgi:hypothetical protein